jgi:UDP-N-acetylglucosamine--N-acetylmuramyl-(pentapeptide) pyrophosphoryl-undecaprenol N-acetylglucosamine transferase
MTRYFITGGGTGGHIYPAIAVADALLENAHDEVFYVGNPKNLEYDIVKGKGYKFLGVNIHGMPRKIDVSLLKWSFELLFATITATYYLLKYKPKAVFGTGGYVSAPILIASKFLKVPYMMHDCDAQPGLVTRKLAPSAKCVSLAFDCAIKSINNKNCHINGNPIRAEFKTLTKEQARKNLGLENKLTLCIMGGSQGARSINDATVEVLKKLDMQIIFQTGKKNFDRVIEQLLKIYPNYEVNSNLIIKPYFDDMVTVLKASDIAVSRSGSLSISEICASGIAPIFVPYPYASGDHQRKNAKFMVEKGAGIYIEDKDINEKTLFDAVNSAIENLDEMQKNSLALAKLDGVEKIVEQLRSL